MAFDYSSRDYNSIKSDLLSRAARIVPEWSDRDPADFGMVLVDLWAQMGDVLHYYVDRAAGETFLPTATQRESVLSFANLFDYVPNARTSAAGTVTLRNANSQDYDLPQYSSFIIQHDTRTYYAYTSSPETLVANSDTTIPILEGIVVNNPAETLTESSDGQASQRYILSNTGVVRDSIVVYVYEDGVTPTEYRYINRMSAAVDGDRVFSVRLNATGQTQIVFGTNTNGFIPPVGATITCVYAYSSGVNGNFPANTVKGFKGVTPTAVSVVSSSAFFGGLNEESIDSMKRTIPSVISAQNRAVTKGDYLRLALSTDGVSKAAVQYIPSNVGASANASVRVYAQENREADYLTTEDTSQTVSAALAERVVSYIQPRAVLGVDVITAPTITWREIDITVTVYVTAGVKASKVQQDVSDVLDNVFSFGNVSFNQTTTLGYIYRTILNVFGVDYAEIDLYNYAGLTGVEKSLTVGEFELPKKGTFTITTSGGITS